MTISPVNSWSATSSVTLSISPSKIGNILIVSATVFNPAKASITLSGGGISTWNFNAGSNNYDGSTYDYVQSLAWGVVTSTGPQTITLTVTGTMQGTFVEEFTSSSGVGTWSFDQSNGTSNFSSPPQTNWVPSGSISAPSLTANQELIAVAGTYNNGGSTTLTPAGYVFQTFAAGNGGFAYAVESGPQPSNVYNPYGACAPSYTGTALMTLIFTLSVSSQVVMIV